MGSAEVGDGRRVAPVDEEELVEKGKMNCMEEASRVNVAGLALGMDTLAVVGTEGEVG